jgi:hypothetical protein
MSDETLRNIIIASLANAALFYVMVITVFLIARKTRLNKALATQKAFWLMIVVSTLALLAWHWHTPHTLQAAVWVGLSLATWWVFVEVFRANKLTLYDWWQKHGLW